MLISLNFVCLLAAQVISKRKDINDMERIVVIGTYGLICITMTCVMANITQRKNVVKKTMNYAFDVEDICFEKTSDVFHVSAACMVVAMLCGITGISGGTVLGPLFLSYGMNPQVMGGTTQYVTMFSVIIIVIQYSIAQEMHWPYSITSGVTALIATFTGIKLVQYYIRMYKK